MIRLLNSLLVLIACLTTAFGQTKITASEAAKIFEKNKKAQLLDVRTQKEYTDKHIANSINLDWNQKAEFEEGTLSKLNKKSPVYVYCLSGGRSAQAAKNLADRGFTVYEIEGGILKWEATNLPLEKNLSQAPKGITLKQFKALTKDEQMVLVDFHASWCGPCKEMEPSIKQIAEKYAGRVKVLKIDVDENDTLTKQLGITSIPVLYLYKGGKRI
ncbi:thioredoxin domain-containing protein [Sphingobacterium faecale]|uniref:Redoxin domain-containing protein n=1 Tax=Sphingobacterium faecale TaxID=2803775 RepID=A0ABS1R2T5_9SPHI|nr:thioredoxin domain-containing protein [Sphingobacterium faecale]MBL1408765.1 redoxin domain-containing protein [Sphingobacterium faecale]